MPYREPEEYWYIVLPHTKATGVATYINPFYAMQYISMQ